MATKDEKFLFVLVVVIVAVLAVGAIKFFIPSQTSFVGSPYIPIFPKGQLVNEQCTITPEGKDCTAQDLHWIINPKTPSDIDNGGRGRYVAFENITLETGFGVSNAQSGNFLHIAGVNSPTTITHDFRGQFGRVALTAVGGIDVGGLGAHKIYVASELCNSGDIGKNLANVGSTQPANLLLEIVPNSLNSSQYKIFCNGVESNGVHQIKDTESLTVQFFTTGHLYIREASYLPMYSCAVVGDEKLAIETFEGGKTIDKYSGRYEMKRFCLNHGVIRVNADAQGSDEAPEPLVLLNEGKQITIPQRETWTILYVIDGKNVPTKCDFTNEAIGKNGECQPINGVVQICTGGAYDVKLGTCTTTPPQNGNACVVGETIVKLPNGSISCVSYPPVDQLCNSLSLVKTANGSGCAMREEAKCKAGYTLTVVSTDPIQYSCEKSVGVSKATEAITSIIPESVTSNAELNPFTISLGFVAIIIGLALYGTFLNKGNRRKRK